ncbi:hypothetical protein PI95_021085 [Hassallia byssoidea VB512170]|uniref:Uncharacterized protein n=1 Tax=Hassallia byssoidea VB512170 TaxID=1304833 RepID=A0A846HDW0_9CYAN|nr:hypothetical protein [Hassalia byssoidea]NEU74979.1 hypothetical protein [Hassalia byssoidea VB512170]
MSAAGIHLFLWSDRITSFLISYGWCVCLELLVADTETIGYSDIPLPVTI